MGRHIATGTRAAGNISAAWDGTGAEVAGSVVGPATGHGSTTFGVQVVATVAFVGITLQFEASLDGTNFFAVLATPYAGGPAVSSSTAAGNWIFYCPGAVKVRVRCSAYVAGTPTITLQGGTAAGAVNFGALGGTMVTGAAADGAAVAGNPVLTAGFDGTNAQTLLTDTTGREIVVGAAADGAAVAGNPVLTAGFDGTNAQTILTDTTGREVIVGAAADGAAVAGNPVLVAGQDGTNAQSVLTDTSGRQMVIGGAASGAAIAGNPVPVAVLGDDGNAYTARGAGNIADATGVARSVMLMVPALHQSANLVREANSGFVEGDNSDMAPIQAMIPYQVNNISGTIRADKMRGNSDNTGLASAGYASTQTILVTIYNERFLRVTFDLTIYAGAPAPVVTIDVKDALSGKWTNLLTGAAVTGVSTNVYEVGIGVTPVVNKTINSFLGRNMRIVITPADATSITYSVGYTKSV